VKAFLVAVGILLLGLCAVGLLRVLKGPTVVDRVIGGSFVGTLAVVLLVLIGLLYERLEAFVDIALMYSLLSFIGTLIYAKYLSKKGVSDG